MAEQRLDKALAGGSSPLTPTIFFTTTQGPGW